MSTLFLLCVLFSSSAWAAEDFEEQKSVLSNMADISCIGIKPLGICPKAKHIVGALVLLREPSLIIQTVKKSESAGLGSGNLHFNEVRVVSNPAAKAFHQAICSDLPDFSPAIYYVSEPDALAWRSSDIERNLPESILAANIAAQCREKPLGYKDQCMKSWGPLYPRTGYAITPSEPTASAISAVRAVSIAQNPKPSHIIESKMNYSFNIREDKLQMLQPTLSASCISIGEAPDIWEKNKTSKDGKYVWAYWNWRLCCI